MTRTQITSQKIRSAQKRLDVATEELKRNPDDLRAELAVNSYSSLLEDLAADLMDLLETPPVPELSQGEREDFLTGYRKEKAHAILNGFTGIHVEKVAKRKMGGLQFVNLEPPCIRDISSAGRVTIILEDGNGDRISVRTATPKLLLYDLFLGGSNIFGQKIQRFSVKQS